MSGLTGARLVVVVPARDCGDSLAAVLERLPAELPVVVVDDGSSPPLSASGPRVTLLRHPINRGYGAAQKTGYAEALAQGADRVVMVHGDGQYDLVETLALAERLDEADAALGSRFLADPTVIPAWRRWGNRVLTGLANRRFGVRHTELHTGARAYRAEVLRRVDLAALSDDYLFDQELLVALFRAGARVAEGPVHTRYDATVQSIPLRKAVRYFVGCVGAIVRG